jgi:menaquinone-9 beta-reductase
MPDVFDVAIVGARVAGSTLASLLGDAGYRVLLIDSATFPSDTISTHFFRGGGLVMVLERLGVLDEVLALDPPRLSVEYTLRAGDAAPTIGGPQVPGSLGYGLSVRRLPLDSILVDRARRTPGVKVLEAATARALLRDEAGRVVGLVIEHDGERLEVQSRLVVGADGRASWVARQVGAGDVRRESASRALYYRYVSDYASLGPSHDGPEFSFLGDELVYAFPSDAGVTCLAVSINLEAFASFRSAPEGSFTDRLLAHRHVSERFRAARPVSRVLGSGPKDGVIREHSGPGWALVGDAGLHQDPWTGLGMDNAGVHATFLADAIDDWLRGRSTEATALETYRNRRDDHALEDFEITARAGRDLSAL